MGEMMVSTENKGTKEEEEEEEGETGEGAKCCTNILFTVKPSHPHRRMIRNL